MSGILVVDMAHEPLDFVSGGFKGSQLNWDIYIDGTCSFGLTAWKCGAW